MVKKFIRIILIVAAFFIVSAIVFILGVRIIFPDSRLKRIMATQIRGWTMHEAKIGGLSLGIFNGLEISDFSLSRGNDFRSGTLLHVKRIVFSPGFRPRIIIEQPEVYIKEREFSLKKLIGTLSWLKKPMRPGKYPPFIPSIAELQVTRGVILFIDNKCLSVESVNLTAFGFTPEHPSDIALSFMLVSGKNGVKFGSDVKLDVNAETITLLNARAEAGANALRISGISTGFKDPELRLSLAGDTPVLNSIGEMLSFPSGLGGGILRLTGGLGGKSVNLNITGDFDNIRIQGGNKY
jgi:hypothetical protein